ncbi:hypothetical protein EC973_008174 [Apophysomyces ossiformis]|uniref:Protein-serine/threonine kinase n=1 Tax=Apophysomyces ossiformis TaxID=679940 RepID=A0A8H7ETT8_9FUNG|nr:hypothetical protein EC973_008174 [Apophysomyces ossiformis]
MLQSQILNALPRRILANLWASKETRISLSHLSHAPSLHSGTTQLPVAATPSFLCSELPVRCTHLLRLLSTLTPESLQTPIIRHVAHQYLHDICTLLHPSLRATSQRAFSDVLRRLRHRQAASLVRLRYALLATPTPSSVSLMESINNIGIGIHVLAGQHLSWSSDDIHQRVQSICPVEIAEMAAKDARDACAGLGPVPEIAVYHQKNIKDLGIIYAPGILHRILYESMVLALRAQIIRNEETQRQQSWFQRQLSSAFDKHQALNLQVFGGATSIGFRLESPAPLSPRDMMPNVPRDPMGMPSASGVLSRTRSKTIRVDDDPDNLEWECLEGWRTAKQLASHWGGHLDCVSTDGLGTTIYLALERDPTLVERYPTRSLASSAHSLLRHQRRISAAAAAAANSGTLTLDAATVQLDTFLHAISDSQYPVYQPLKQDHSVSLTAAVSHA